MKVRREYVMKDLEMKIKLLEKENEQLKQEKEFWHNEAIKQTAAHGETKMRITKLINNHFEVSNE
jgi:predicted chitinase